jgi:hypothetical protein
MPLAAAWAARRRSASACRRSSASIVSPCESCVESLKLHRRAQRCSKWEKVLVRASVCYRYYAINVFETFCIGMIDLSDVLDRSDSTGAQLELPLVYS